MKKLSIIILLAFMILNINLECKTADKKENLANSTEFTEIKNLENKMLSETEVFLTEQKISFNDLKICYDKAAKIYIDVEMSELTSVKETDIKNILNEQDYVWVIPVEGLADTNEKYIKVTVARGLPLREEIAHLLTEEQKQQIREQEGKWKISEIALVTGEIYTSQLDKKSNLIDGYAIVGGIKGMHHPIAIGYKDGEAKYWLDLGFSYEALESRALYVSNILLSDTASKMTGVYDYQTVKNLLNEWPTEQGESGGGSGTFSYGKAGLYQLLATGAIIAVLVYVVEKETRKNRF